MKLRSLSPWPKSYDWLHSLTLNLTPDGRFQAVRILKPGSPEEGEFEILFEGSQDECVAHMKNVVNQDRESQRSFGEANHPEGTSTQDWS
jgi:hypothetical protein